MFSLTQDEINRLVHWQTQADERRTQRGHRYAAEGRVGDLLRSGDRLTATVHGTEPYRVRLVFKPDMLHASCPCPDADEHTCKHQIAVATTALNHAARKDGSLHPLDPSEADMLEPATARWLERLANAPTLSEPRQYDPEAMWREVVFILALHPSGAHLGVFSREDFDEDAPALSWPAFTERYGEHPIYDLLFRDFRESNERYIKLDHVRLTNVLHHLLPAADMRWPDRHTPVGYIADPLQLRVRPHSSKDTLTLQGELFDGASQMIPDSVSVLRPAHGWARVDDVLRPITPAPDAILALLMEPVSLSLDLWATRRAALEPQLRPWLSEPITDPRYESLTPEAVHPVVRLSPHGSGMRVERLVRYRFPFGQLEMPATPDAGQPAEVWTEAHGRRIRFFRDAQAEQALSAAGDDSERELDEAEAVAFVETLAALPEKHGIMVEGLETAERFRLQKGEWNLEVHVTGDTQRPMIRWRLTFDGEAVDAESTFEAWMTRKSFAAVEAGRTAFDAEVMGRLTRLRTAHGIAKHHQAIPLRSAFALLSDPAWNAQVDPVWEKLQQRIRNFKGLSAPRLHKGFEAELRPYQERGVAWLCFLGEFGLGGCLADDMGLGKTVQALALLHQLHAEEGQQPPSLVIAPASVAWNWRQEAERFCPRLKVTVARSGRELTEALEEEWDVIITSYDLVTRARHELSEQDLTALICDEAQALKNSRTVRARTIRDLHAAHRIMLTGTPLENHLGELKSVLDAAMPGFLGDDTRFRQRYQTPIEMGNPEVLQELRNTVGPLLLRRTKEEVAPELPPKSESLVWCELGPAQRTIYQNLVGAYRVSVKEHIKEMGFARSKLHILEVLLRLRQAACHTALLPPELGGNSSYSTKFEAVEELLSEALAGNGKVLIFSQFVSLLSLLRERLPADVEYAWLEGKTRNREAVIRRFQEDPACRLFLLSLHAGGRGLNLTAADYVIFLDPWWNPAVEDQARDRAHRIGQDKHVFVYRVAARDTVEEVILNMQSRKRRMFDDILSGASARKAEALTRGDVAQLLEMDEGEL